ncbi:unnamed protein product [Closterium sp. NIES-54]
MDVSRTSMCHASAPQFQWPQTVCYVAHQLNPWPSDAWPRGPVLVVSGGVGGAAAEGESNGATGAGGAGSGGAGVLQFPPRSPPRPVVAESGGVPAGGTGGPGFVVGGGSSFGGAGAGAGTLEQQQGQVPPQQTPEEAEQQRLRGLPDPAPARLVRGPLPSHPVPPVESLASSPWNRRSPLSRDVSPELHRFRYNADGPVHLVLHSRVPPPPVLPHPPESSLTVFPGPLSDYLRASHPVVSRVLSSLVTHSTAPPLSVSALITTTASLASSHRLDYASHLVSGTARSPSTGGVPGFALEVLEDRQFELGFLTAAVPHLCAMLLAPEGDPDALEIPIPRTYAEEVSGPWASYWIPAEEVEMASYRSTGTYVGAVPPPGENVVSGMWLFKVRRSPGAPPMFKARYVARVFS